MTSDNQSRSFRSSQAYTQRFRPWLEITGTPASRPTARYKALIPLTKQYCLFRPDYTTR
jgi:hypothetical protein